LIFHENRRKPWLLAVILGPLGNQAFNSGAALINRSICGKSLAKQMPKTSIDADHAAAISLKALAFLARDSQRLARFLALTGVEPAALRSLALEREFQSAVLEHMLGDESMVLEFCAIEAIDPGIPAAALQVLSSSPWPASPSPIGDKA
jgi:hypothetical protein